MNAVETARAFVRAQLVWMNGMTFEAIRDLLLSSLREPGVGSALSDEQRHDVVVSEIWRKGS